MNWEMSDGITRSIHRPLAVNLTFSGKSERQGRKKKKFCTERDSASNPQVTLSFPAKVSFLTPTMAPPALKFESDPHSPEYCGPYNLAAISCLFAPLIDTIKHSAPFYIVGVLPPSSSSGPRTRRALNTLNKCLAGCNSPPRRNVKGMAPRPSGPSCLSMAHSGFGTQALVRGRLLRAN